MTHVFTPGWSNGQATESCLRCGLPKHNTIHDAAATSEQPSK